MHPVGQLDPRRARLSARGLNDEDRATDGQSGRYEVWEQGGTDLVARHRRKSPRIPENRACKRDEAGADQGVVEFHDFRNDVRVACLVRRYCVMPNFFMSTPFSASVFSISAANSCGGR